MKAATGIGAALDPRAKLLFVILTSTASFALSGWPALFALFAVGLLLHLNAKNFGFALRGAAFFLFVFALDSLFRRCAHLPLLMGLSMLTHMTATFMPTVMIAWWAVKTTDIGELLCALGRMRLPAGLLLVLAVTFRFLPTVGHEFRYIRASMKMRGIDLNGRSLLAHPLRTLEYALVPLLIRSMRIAENLAASAVTRGLDAGRPRSSFRDARLGRADFVAMTLFVLLILTLGALT